MVQGNSDKIFERFLFNSFEKAKRMEAQSDILSIFVINSLKLDNKSTQEGRHEEQLLSFFTEGFDFQEYENNDRNRHILSKAPDQFLVKLDKINHLVKDHTSGQIQLIQAPINFYIHFPVDYLRSIDPHLYLRVVTVLRPDFFHPNIRIPQGWVCLGHNFQPGTPLADLIYHLYEIITYQNITVDERDAYNPEACRYLRSHKKMKISAPPLFRRDLNLDVTVEKM
jgi:hypothetical protein